MKSGALPILTYHAIDTSEAVTSTDPSWFVATIDALLESGFQAVDLGRWIGDGRPPVERGFAITFDDGPRSILNVADRLARLSIPATVFLVSDRIGLDNQWPGQPVRIPVARLLGRADLETLRSLGWSFGSHGCSHRAFTKLNPDHLLAEMVASRDRVEQVAGGPCPLLAYPYGSANPRIRRAASEIFDAAFGTRLAYASATDDLFDLSRIDAYYLRSPQALKRLISGRWRGRLAARRALRAIRGTVGRLSPV